MRPLLFLLACLAFPITGFRLPPGADAGFTGYATSIVTADSIAIQCLGWADRKREIHYDSLTVQPVGSVSKVLIGLSLLIAQEKGILDLDADIQSHLDFSIDNPYPSGNQSITLRHLATHTSGIVDHPKFYRRAYTKGLKPSMTLETYLKEYLTQGGRLYSRKNFTGHGPGEVYEYSNVGAALAAYVVEKAAGMSFQTFTRRYILSPLDMDHSGWSHAQVDPSRHATLYDEKDQALPPYTLVTYPDGGLRTTISDLSRLLQELIKGYQGTSSLLSEKSWKALFEKQFTDHGLVRNINSKEPNTGLFVVYSKSGKIGHSGSDPGVCAMMWFDPATSRGKVFLANEDLTTQNVGAFQKIWEALE